MNYYFGSTFINSFEWHNDSTVTEFTLHEMPFLYPDADSIKITIIGGAINGATDGCHYKSISHIDDMKIGESNSNSVIREDFPELIIYPNPAFEELNILYDENKDFLIKVYNILGNEVFQGVNIHKINISAFKTGFYFVELLDLNSNKNILKKVIFLNKQ
ncbi:MAG: T9SS type A sorting domain-containing protein [Saprospiraceae bacterium]|nr:T9SS type A sorting domain-containing protein [Saprospiraceae bacterium]